MRPTSLLLLAAALVTLALVIPRVALAQQGVAVAYASWERPRLDGCVKVGGPCYTACRQSALHVLHDDWYTVARNPRLGLRCGQRITVCGPRRCAHATVTDRTASRYDFELTYALSIYTGAPNGWDGPRTVRWWRDA